MKRKVLKKAPRETVVLYDGPFEGQTLSYTGQAQLSLTFKVKGWAAGRYEGGKWRPEEPSTR